MSMQKERKIWRNATCKVLDQKGWKWIKFSDKYRAGTLDIYAYKKGIDVWFEFKTPNGKLSKLQKIEIANLEGQKIPVYVVDSVKLVRKIIDNIDANRYVTPKYKAKSLFDSKKC